MKVRYSYLPQKFKNILDPDHEVYKNLQALIKSGAYTLGPEVEEFEQSFAKLIGSKYAIGVANGTDALRISLRMAGVRPGDEVITAANTFVASAGCIDELFATPKFIDMAPWYTMDSSLIEKAITKRTKAIIPVHFTGEPAEMDEIMHIADKYGIPVIEDACQAVLAEYKGKCVGNFGLAGAFSLHPLKNLNCLGDGGIIATNDEQFAKRVRQYRNHGMYSRDWIQGFGCNSRLDTMQAIFLNYLIRETKTTVAIRRENAAYYDKELGKIPGIALAPRRAYVKQCFHLYMFEVTPRLRQKLLKHLIDADIEAKVHYPIPLQGAHLTIGLDEWGAKSLFPKAYAISDRIITLPVDEHLTQAEQDYCIEKVKEFMHEHL